MPQAHGPQSHPASPWLFFAAIVCFALPWANFTCQGQPVLQMSGYNLVVGGKADDLLLIKPRGSGTTSQRDVLGDSRSNSASRTRSFGNVSGSSQPAPPANVPWNATFYPSQVVVDKPSNDRAGYLNGDVRAATAFALLVGCWLGSIHSMRRHAVSVVALLVSCMFGGLWLVPRLSGQNLNHSLDLQNPLIVGGAICVTICVTLMIIENVLRRKNLGVPVALAAFTVGLLLWLKLAAEREIGRESGGALQVVMLGGFWAVIALTAAGGASWVLASKPAAIPGTVAAQTPSSGLPTA